MSKHTPGPWVIKESATHVRVVGADDENIFHDDKSCPRVMGDAHLISAAPELLEAASLIRAALQKHGEWDDGCFYFGGKSASELQYPIAALTAAIAKATGE